MRPRNQNALIRLKFARVKKTEGYIYISVVIFIEAFSHSPRNHDKQEAATHQGYSEILLLRYLLLFGQDSQH